jgi:MFS transporter, ACS family, D-galactonate transporter
MRRPFLLFYALIFIDEVALLALVPLLPAYTRAYHLSAVRAGVLLSAASLAIVVASVPAGRLADRFGARLVTLAAGALVVVSTAAMAAAPGYAWLLAARSAFGIGSGMIWSAGLSWLSDSAADDVRERALGAVITVAGVAGMAGPVFAGALADRMTVGAAFAVVAAVGAPVVAGLAWGDPGRRVRHDHQPLVRVAGGMRREPLLAGALAIMLLGGVGDGVVNLVAPLQLGDHGLSSGEIGAWFSVSAAIFIVASAVVARMGRRAVSLRGAGVMAGLQAVALVPVLVGAGTPAVLATVLGRSPFVAAPYTIAFPLGALGAARIGVGTGTVNGMLGLVWGGANFAGPLIAGVVLAGAGDRAVYALLAAFSALLGASLLRAGGRDAAAPAAAS